MGKDNEIIYAIRCPNEEFSELLQIELFKLGFKWAGINDLLSPSFLNKPVLCFGEYEKLLRHSSYADTSKDYKEIQFADIYKLFK